MRDEQYWHELSDAERKAIHNPKDCPIIAVIKGMPNELKKAIYKELAYIPSANLDYLAGERPWIEDFGQYLWENELHRAPGINVQFTDLFFKEFSRSNIPVDYRLYYVAKNPTKVENSNRSRELTNFLLEVGEKTNWEYGILPILAG